jgi:chemotaxis protein histidine kinase CheA
MDAKSKTCSKCGEEKLLEEFYIRKGCSSGRSGQCKSCRQRANRQYKQANKEKIKAYYQANKEKIKAKHKAYREANKEKIAANDRRNGYKWRQANKEKIEAQRKQYYQANKEKIAAKSKRYAQDNKEKIAAWQKQYRQDNKEKRHQYLADNKEKIEAQRKQYGQANKERLKKLRRDRAEKARPSINKYVRDRYKNNEQFRIRCNLSSGLNQALKKIGKTKKASILSYIGCSIEFMKEHLNSTKKTDWGDDLHIDHIIPCSLFDHTDEEEIKKCWNWRNLRYLPAEENSSKGDALDMDLIKSYGIEDLLPEGVDK